MSLSQMMRKSSPLNKSFSVLIGILLALCGAVAYIDSWKPIAFNAGQWRAAREKKHYKTCYRMRDSLVEELKRSHLNFQEIVTLLGKPDFRAGHALYTYRLGRSCFSITYYSLAIWLDENNDLSEA